MGIGEDDHERAASVFAIRELHRRYGHVQEAIVQNFRAKPGTAMANAPEPDDEAFLAAVATTRVVMGPHVSVQAPPNLSDRSQQLRLLDADQRLGRRLARHARSREPRAPVAGDRARATTTASRGWSSASG